MFATQNSKNSCSSCFCCIPFPFLIVTIFLTIFLEDSFFTTFLWLFFALTTIMSGCLVVATRKKLVPSVKNPVMLSMKPPAPDTFVLVKPVPVFNDEPAASEKMPSQPKPAFCEFCGAELAPGVRFCQYCGAEVQQ